MTVIPEAGMSTGFHFVVDHEEAFGEIYHVAAAMVLETTVTATVIGQDGDERMEQALWFLREMGGKDRVKQSPTDVKGDSKHKATEIIAKSCAGEGIEKLRDAFLGISVDSSELDELLRSQLGPRRPRALIWSRKKKDNSSHRDTTDGQVRQLVTLVKNLDAEPILIGDPIEEPPSDAVNLLAFYKWPLFKRVENIALQLRMFDLLRRDRQVLAAVGMMSGGMDGPAFFIGIPTIWLARRKEAKGRMLKLEEKLPGYEFVCLPEYQREFPLEVLGGVRNKLVEHFK